MEAPNWLVVSRIRRRLFEEQNGRCFYCNILMTLTNPNLSLYCTIDHVIPRSRGGTWDYENLVGACSPCNYCKKSKSAIEFLASEEFASISRHRSATG